MNSVKPFGIIIEDSVSTAKMFSIALEEAGFNTEIILDGATAQKRLGEISPDVLILDLHLPFTSGEEILEKIKTSKNFRATKVIIATADANFAKHVQDDTNVDFVFLKPISYEQLHQLATRLKNRIDVELNNNHPFTGDPASWQNSQSFPHTPPQ